MKVYDCHSEKVGPEPRGRSRTAWMQDGWRVITRGEIVTREPIMVQTMTDWKKMGCGHVVEPWRRPDRQCQGCAWDKSTKEEAAE